jgi:hypothetical protein
MKTVAPIRAIRTIAVGIPLLLGLLGVAADAAIPTTRLYPFRGYDLDTVRATTRAESGPETEELAAAWSLYREIQGSWMPTAPKPSQKSIARLDRLKSKLEGLAKPEWFSDAMSSPQSGSTQLAEKVGDQVFEKQKATPEYQELKALAIVYLTEHELDRAGAAEQAGRFLTALSATHPWDWEIHGLYSRFLVDAQLPGPAWATAIQSIFLNPKPNLDDLKFFAFIGSVAAKDEWPEIQEAIRQAAPNGTIAELAIVESGRAYGADAKVNLVPRKDK